MFLCSALPCGVGDSVWERHTQSGGDNRPGKTVAILGRLVCRCLCPWWLPQSAPCHFPLNLWSVVKQLHLRKTQEPCKRGWNDTRDSGNRRLELRWEEVFSVDCEQCWWTNSMCNVHKPGITVFLFSYFFFITISFKMLCTVAWCLVPAFLCGVYMSFITESK